jgi:hypothetical protein
METLEKSGRIKAFFKQGDFAKETLLCLADISNCLEKFMASIL